MTIETMSPFEVSDMGESGPPVWLTTSCSWTFGVYMRVSCVVSSSFTSIAHTCAHRQFKADNHTDSMQMQDAGRMKCRPVDDHSSDGPEVSCCWCPMMFHRICLRQSRRCNRLVEREGYQLTIYIGKLLYGSVCLWIAKTRRINEAASGDQAFDRTSLERW